jgi:ribonucleotide reductase beta subunit family protein with ferritin-like domain
MSGAHELHLHDPQTLYRHWEESQWSPWDLDLSADRAQWKAMEDRSLVSFVLGSLMVAEERITTKRRQREPTRLSSAPRPMSCAASPLMA